MKKLILLYIISLSLFSCTTDPFKDIDQNNYRYIFECESDQPNLYMDITIEKNCLKITYPNITNGRFEYTMTGNELITVNLKHKSQYSKISTFCKLKISKYNKDNLDLLYKAETNTNSIDYKGIVLNNGTLK